MKLHLMLILFSFGINLLFTGANFNQALLSNPSGTINFEIIGGEYKENGEFYTSEACLYGDSLKLKFVHEGKFQTLFFYVHEIEGDNLVFGVEHEENCQFNRKIYEYKTGDIKVSKIGNDSISLAVNSILVYRDTSNMASDTMHVYGSLLLKSTDCKKK